ncbi:hypothetical protein PHISCL_03130 [Aspergillus sclerotialis]|uniref:C6 transcription factor n=1 Tax=Aspergillus sclerotialis TaxID=2070753 RepID=A0A3A2ZQH0_9EURO|nr:hypothetical protein PHISCL_03130 [Aspergillus sclerotialis]
MDNGVLQREQASRFKNIVSKSKSANGRKRVNSATHSSEDFNRGMVPLSTENNMSRVVPPPVSACPFLNEWNGAVAEEDLLDTSLTGPPWSRPSSSDELLTESQFFFSHQAHVPPSMFPNSIEYGQNLLSNPLSEGTSWRFHNLQGVRQAHTTPSDFSQDGVGFGMIEKPVSDLDKLPKDVTRPVSQFLRQSSMPSPISPGESSTCGETEDALFMHYLDRVFYFQFPFYHSRDRKGRGWLFSILKRVKPAYYATLALSQRDILSEQPHSSDIATGLSRLRAKDGYYDLAVQGTRHIMENAYTWNGDNHVVHCIESLTSLLQLVFWELLAGGVRNWQGQLRAAANLIPELVEARVQSTISDSTFPNYTRHQHTRALSLEEESATSLLLGSFISFDIISCASTRRVPFLDIDHLHVLKNLSIPLESITGCRNSIMALIHEVSLLDRWKEECQAAHRLSIIGLAERGRQIEERLRKELASMGTKLSKGLQVCNHAGVPPAPSHPEVSKLFALSAIIYLHVVISGAHPELPEIAEAVSQAVSVFQGLHDRSLLQGILVWPFCISGCLALQDQQSFFRDLFYSTGVTESSIGTCFEAFKIMEECWEARKARSSSCDWVSIMNRRGYCVLLR